MLLSKRRRLASPSPVAKAAEAALQPLESRLLFAVGDLDATFGAGGKVLMDFGSTDSALVVARQADGKLIEAGGSGTALAQNFVLVRYDANGAPDPTFGNAGTVVTDMGGADQIHAIAIQSDGKIVVAGVGGDSHMAIARYNPDGSLDTTFDGDGKLIFTVPTSGPSNFDNAFGIAVQSDGKVLVGGSSGPTANGPFDQIVVRFNTNGSLDTTFGGGAGFTLVDYGNTSDVGFAMAMQSDGRIVIAGGSADTGNAPAFTSEDVSLARLTTTGALDTTFGGGTGKVRTDLGLFEFARAITLDTSGRVIISGETQASSNSSNHPRNGLLIRYNPDGSLDSSFGTNGSQSLDIGGNDEELNAVAVDAAGNIVAAGTIFPFANVAAGNLLVARFLNSGALDPAFGGGAGFVIVDVNNSSADDGQGVLFQPDGKIVVAGNETAAGHDTDFALVRLVAEDPRTAGTATLRQVSPVTAAGGATQDFTIDFTDADGLSPSTFDGSDVRVIGPNGFDQPASLVSADATSPTSVAATYRIAAPGGSFDAADSGTYTITLQANQVTDNAAQAFAARDVGAFQVAITAPPGGGDNRVLLGQFGRLNGSKKATKVTFNADNGVPVTFSLKGAGTGSVFRDGATLDVLVDGASGSSLTLASKSAAAVDDVLVNGTLKSLSAKAISLTGTAFAQAITKAVFGSITGGTLAAPSLSSVQVGGAVTNGRVLAGANLGADGKLGGTGTDADSFGPALLKSFKAASLLGTSVVGAGLSLSGDGVLDGTGDAVIPGGQIKAIKVASVDATSRFASASLPTTVKVGTTKVTPGTDPRFVTSV